MFDLTSLRPDLKPEVLELASRAESRLANRFLEIDRVAEINTARIMNAFRSNRVSDSCFAGTTGYGYDDKGREVIDAIFAEVFGGAKALVRIGFVNGTHALACMLFGVLQPGQKLLSVTGAPYDTLQTVIGIAGDAPGSLKDYGIGYTQVDLLENGDPDLDGIRAALSSEKTIGAVLIQRSRGYGNRRAFTVAEIKTIVDTVHKARPDVVVAVDNCYGEFCETAEPTHVGADIMAGSLIKNPGGGLAPTGAYIAGREELVERAAARLTTPGIGGECGSTLGNNRLILQGFLTAPHTVAQALKTACLCAAILEDLGYETSPGPLDPRADIIQMIILRDGEKLKKFCGGIQHGSPVDSFVTPEPWQMPGYDSEVIMAAGAFIQGSSIELSCDGPMRAPYIAYLQGGITYELGKYGILTAISDMMD
jgi:cystathionine beta-lyase family protein involved in aluminum resistance